MNPMKFVTVIIALVFINLSLYAGENDEITLFDSGGNPVAYIDTADDDLTIYLWDGTPVAYIYPESNSYHIYGFNGNHLGWFKNGIVRDHDGYAVGATEDAFSGYTKYEPYKSYKKYKPYQSYRKYAPYEPYFKNSWSRTDLRLFLRNGAR
jgi:hypothetical protein